MPEFQPVRFGKYILLDKIATGGMAQLYKAKITGIQGFEKLIAIKMILPHLAKEKELVVSFIDEAKLAALLNHQNIIQIYDFGSMEDSFFISMEYLYGNDLRAIWLGAREKNQPISLENALYIMSRVCSGLAYAHELKDFQGNSLHIIHRDISPQNIFVTYQGDVKILDFGIAKAASQSTVTQCGMIKGKVAYMSPEQAAGKSIDQRSDIFSAGIVLYELIAHCKMFDGDSTIQILTKVRDAEYRPMPTVVSGLHSKVYAILDRALAKEPADRYQSCAEMASDLEECIIELGLRPNARGLSLYMKALFESKMEAEGQHAKESSGSFGSGSREIKDEKVLPSAPEKPKAVLPSEQPSVKKVPEKKPEKAVEKAADQAPQKAPANVPEKAPEKPPEKAAAKTPAKAPEKAADGQKKTSWLIYGAAVLVIAIAVAAIVVWQLASGPSPKTKAAAPAEQAKVQPPQPAPTDDGKVKSMDLVHQALNIMDKESAQAKALLLDAIKQDPQNEQAHFQLGRIYVKMRDYPKAIESYTEVLKLNPNFTDVYSRLGFAYGMNENYDKAEEVYQQLVQMNPPDLDVALYNLAVIQDKQGKKEECLASLEKAYAFNSENKAVKTFLDKMKRSAKKKK